MTLIAVYFFTCGLKRRYVLLQVKKGKMYFRAGEKTLRPLMVVYHDRQPTPLTPPDENSMPPMDLDDDDSASNLSAPAPPGDEPPTTGGQNVDGDTHPESGVAKPGKTLKRFKVSTG